MTGRGKTKRERRAGAGAEAQAAEHAAPGEGAGDGAGEGAGAGDGAGEGAGAGALHEAPAGQAPEAGAEAAPAEAASAGTEAEDGMHEARAAEESPEAVARRLEQENESLRERLLRLAADFENHRKRSEASHRQALRYGSENLLRDLLQALDDLERAVAYGQAEAGAAPGEAAGPASGVELVARGIFDALQKHGLSPAPAKGKPFDPKLHEAMSQLESAEHPEGTVVEVLQKGYLLHERLLRPARVVVAKAPATQEAGDEPEER